MYLGKYLYTKIDLFNNSSIDQRLDAYSFIGIQHLELDVIVYSLKVDIIQKFTRTTI